MTDLRFGRYEALFRIGLGGMAEVYAARIRGEGGFQKLVAVKRMLPHLTGDQKFVDMFLDEARLAANIVSPHVAQTFDLGRAEDESLYIVMELIVGVNLTHFLVFLHEQEQFVDVSMGVELIAQAAQGLDDAHEARAPTGESLKLVHRDISPQNIMVGLDGRVRVTDFGIAQALHLRTTQTQAGEKKGKYSYFAPEQAFGRPVDRRTDMFALAVVAWELLLGRRLFPGTPLEALEAVRDKAIAPPHTLREEIPEDVSRVIMRALERDPEARFATGADFARALRDEARKHFNPPSPREIGDFVEEAGGEWLQALRRAISTADTNIATPLPESVPATNASAVWSAFTEDASTARRNQRDLERAAKGSGTAALAARSGQTLIKHDVGALAPTEAARSGAARASRPSLHDQETKQTTLPELEDRDSMPTVAASRSELLEAAAQSLPPGVDVPVASPFPDDGPPRQTGESLADRWGALRHRFAEWTEAAVGFVVARGWAITRAEARRMGAVLGVTTMLGFAITVALADGAEPESANAAPPAPAPSTPVASPEGGETRARARATDAPSETAADPNAAHDTATGEPATTGETAATDPTAENTDGESEDANADEADAEENRDRVSSSA
ncbi:MAG: serine/threonine protein kinase, partial [Myxococcales bacterium]|nr:serine/threonine protein kinase [Myxococcales bacterium]